MVAMHVAETCPVCAPIISREAYKRGREKARQNEIPTVVHTEELPPPLGDEHKV